MPYVGSLSLTWIWSSPGKRDPRSRSIPVHRNIILDTGSSIRPRSKSSFPSVISFATSTRTWSRKILSPVLPSLASCLRLPHWITSPQFRRHFHSPVIAVGRLNLPSNTPHRSWQSACGRYDINNKQGDAQTTPFTPLHHILLSPYHFIRTNQPVSFPHRVFSPPNYILEITHTSLHPSSNTHCNATQTDRYHLWFGHSISAKLASHQCHFPLGRAVYIVTAEPVCPDEPCSRDEDCDSPGCFCDHLTGVGYAGESLNVYADIEISRYALHLRSMPIM